MISEFENPWDNGVRDKGRNPLDNIPQSLREVTKKLADAFFGNKSAGQPPNTGHDMKQAGSTRLAGLIFFSIIIASWFLTGFYTVNTNEQGVVFRLGKYTRTSNHGLNYKLPYPLESVEKISVTRINKEIIGAKVSKNLETRNNVSFNALSSHGDKDKGSSSDEDDDQMLTGDENIISMRFYVQWSIKNAKNYLLNIKDDVGESTVRIVAESAMREVVGTVKLYEALSEQREEIEKRVRIIMEEALDSYGAGIQIESVGILYSYVASEVMDAYRDVQSAKADKEREINQAHAYRNDILPRARGKAKSIIEAAYAYRDSLIANTRGEVERYKATYGQYQKAKEVTRSKLYIETMETVLGPVNKTIIDKGAVVPLIQADRFFKLQSNDGASQK